MKKNITEVIRAVVFFLMSAPFIYMGVCGIFEKQIFKAITFILLAICLIATGFAFLLLGRNADKNSTTENEFRKEKL